jgi:hypothetical protein
MKNSSGRRVESATSQYTMKDIFAAYSNLSVIQKSKIVVSGTLELDNKSGNFSGVPSYQVRQVFGMMKNSVRQNPLWGCLSDRQLALHYVMDEPMNAGVINLLP